MTHEDILILNDSNKQKKFILKSSIHKIAIYIQ